VQPPISLQDHLTLHKDVTVCFDLNDYLKPFPIFIHQYNSRNNWWVNKSSNKLLIISSYG